MTTPSSSNPLKNLSPAEAMERFVLEYSGRVSAKAARDFLKSLAERIPLEHPDRARFEALERVFAVRPVAAFHRKEGDDGDSSPPSGFAWTLSGDMVVADDFNHRIQIYNKDRKLKLCFGEKGKNPGQFMYPRGIAADSDGNIYVADSWNHRVQKFDARGGHVLSFGAYGDGKGEMNEPYDVLVSRAGAVFVVERYNHRIQIFNPDGSSLGWHGSRGSVLEERLAHIHETPPELFPLPAFELPTAIAQDSLGNFYVADSGNHRVRKFDVRGDYVLTLGEKGKEPGRFLYPVSVCVGPNDILYVADLNNNRVQAFTPHGQFLFAIDEGPDGMEFKSPSLVSVDTFGRLHVGLTFDPSVMVFETPTASLENLYKDLVAVHPQDFRIFYGQGWRHEELGSVDNARDDYLKSLFHLQGGKNVISESLSSGFEESLNLPIRYARLVAHCKDKEYSEPLLLQCLDFYDRSIEEYCKKIRDKREKWDVAALSFAQKLAEDEKHVLQGTDNPLVFNKDLYFTEKEDKGFYREIRILFHFFRLAVERRATFVGILLDYGISPANLSACLEAIKTRHRSACRRLLSLMDEKARNEENMLKDFGGIADDRDKFGAFRCRFFSNYRIKDLLFQFQFELRCNLQALKPAALKYKTPEAEAALRELFLEQPDAAMLPKILLGFHENWSPFPELEADYLDILDGWIALDRAPAAMRRLETADLAPVPFDHEDFNAAEFLRSMLVESAPLKKTADGIACGNEMYPPDAFPGNGNDLAAAMHAIFDSLALFEQKTGDIFKEIESSILKRDEFNVKLKKTNPLDKKEPIHLVMNISILDFQIALLRRIVKTLGLNETGNVARLIVGSALLCGGNLPLPPQGRELFDKLQACCGEMRKQAEELKVRRKALFYEKAALDVRLLSDLSSFSPAAVNQVDQTKNRLIEVNVALDQAEVNLIRYNRIGNLLGKLLAFKSATEGGAPPPPTAMEFQYSLGGGGAGPGNFSYPIGITHTLEGDILAVDHNKHNVQKFSRDGIFLFGFGKMGKTPGAFMSPVDIKTDRRGNIYVSDKFNNRIQKFSADGGVLAAFGDAGKPETRLGAIFGISVDNEDNVWVADGQNHCVKVFSPSGEFLRSFGTKGEGAGEMLEPIGICCADNGDFVVGDKSTYLLKRFNRKGELLHAIKKQPGDNDVYTITQNPRYGIFAADAWNCRLHRFTAALEPVSTYNVGGIRAGQFGIISGLSIYQDTLAVMDFDKKRVQVFRLR